MQNLLFRCSFFFLAIIHGSGCSKDTDDADILHIDRTFIFPSGFPPDPGDAGKKTLQGIDSDHDGVRDDLQRWIYARYPKDEQKRKALSQMAVAYQEHMKKDLDETELMAVVDRSEKSIVCLYQTFNGVRADVECGYVKAKAFNTAERTKQFLRFDARLDGRVLESKHPLNIAACE